MNILNFGYNLFIETIQIYLPNLIARPKIQTKTVNLVLKNIILLS